MRTGQSKLAASGAAQFEFTFGPMLVWQPKALCGARPASSVEISGPPPSRQKPGRTSDQPARGAHALSNDLMVPSSLAKEGAIQTSTLSAQDRRRLIPPRHTFCAVFSSSVNGSAQAPSTAHAGAVEIHV